MSVYDEYVFRQDRIDPKYYLQDSSLTMKDYYKQIGQSLKKDVLMVSRYLGLNAKELLIKLINIAYNKQMKMPRLRIEWSIKQLQLYEQKRYHSIVIYKENY